MSAYDPKRTSELGRIISMGAATDPRHKGTILLLPRNALPSSALGKCVKRHTCSPGERYRAKALELLARAEVERDPQLRTEFETLAAAFLRLAEQAERNTKFVIEFEMPPESDCDPNSKQ